MRARIRAGGRHPRGVIDAPREDRVERARGAILMRGHLPEPRIRVTMRRQEQQPRTQRGLLAGPPLHEGARDQDRLVARRRPRIDPEGVVRETYGLDRAFAALCRLDQRVRPRRVGEQDLARRRVEQSAQRRVGQSFEDTQDRVGVARRGGALRNARARRGELVEIGYEIRGDGLHRETLRFSRFGFTPGTAIWIQIPWPLGGPIHDGKSRTRRGRRGGQVCRFMEPSSCWRVDARLVASCGRPHPLSGHHLAREGRLVRASTRS